MMSIDELKKCIILRKLKQYGEFADDKEALFFSTFAEVHYLNTYKKAYKEALFILDPPQKTEEFPSIYEPFNNLEKGKAFYGLGQYENALSFLGKVTIADYVHHPFDLSIFYAGDAYAALCHLELGDMDKAIKHAEIAVQNISPLPHTPYKDFINETYESIKS